MAKIGCNPVVTATIVLHLSEAEAGALDALAGYGTDEFLRVFYDKMGKAYLQPYEKGLRSLFDSVRGGEASVQSFLRKAKDAREVMDGSKVAIPEVC